MELSNPRNFTLKNCHTYYPRNSNMECEFFFLHTSTSTHHQNDEFQITDWPDSSEMLRMTQPVQPMTDHMPCFFFCSLY